MGNGEITEFDFRFPFYENNNVVVLKNNKPATGYTIVRVSAGDGSDIPYLGGKVVFERAPLPTDSIVISRKLPLSRVVDYQPLAKIEPELLNRDMNYLMETLKDIYDELSAFVGQCKELADNNFVNALIGRLDYLNKIIKNGGVLTRDNAVSAITNCLTFIPQDIKIDLNNGNLILKSGSKVYVPNGINKFNTIVVSSDVEIRALANRTTIVFYSDGVLRCVDDKYCFSGPSAPTVQVDVAVWYDTENNVIKYTDNSGNTWSENNISLPVCIAIETTAGFTEIKQVFNGFGYIGASIFALPGVKGLIPNGRNTDGTLKNTEFTTENVLITTRNLQGDSKPLLLRRDGVINYLTYSYDEVRNINYNVAGSDNNWAIVGVWSANNSGVITSVRTKNSFHAVGYGDKDFIAHQSMPSDSYIDLTLGASGTQYTAPADGYVFLRGQTTVAGKAYGITNEITGMRNQIRVENSGIDFGVFVPVSVGQKFSVKYEGALASGYMFRFVFVNGAR